MAIIRESDPPEMNDVTTTIPAAMLQGQKVTPGDVLQFEAVSVDDNSGDVTVRYAVADETETGGIDEMAAQFNMKG